MGNDFCQSYKKENEFVFKNNSENNVGTYYKKKSSIKNIIPIEIKETIDQSKKIEKGEQKIIKPLKKIIELPKYKFYLNKSFLLSLKEDNYDNLKLKRTYAISRINQIIRKVRSFLRNKNNSNQENNNNKSTKDLLFSYNNIINNEVSIIEYNNLFLVDKEINKYAQKNTEQLCKLNLEENLIYQKFDCIKNAYFLKAHFSNNDKFKAIINIGRKNFYGIYYYCKIGCIYEGYWNNNKKTNIGIEKKWNETCYQGEFLNGKKNGIGSYEWEDGSVYLGYWLNNNIHGYGIFRNVNKSKYYGQFVMNKMSGYGQMTNYNSGFFYYGFWNNNKRNGFGVELTSRNKNDYKKNNKIYVGFWNKNYRHGYGVVLNKDNSKDVCGLWKNNKMIKIYKSIEDFYKVVKLAGFEKYIKFFEYKYENYEEIIKKMISEDEINFFFDKNDNE